MTLVLIGLVGGIITGLSPCVLPVLPVVFLGGGSAGPDAEPGTQPARRRPYLIVLGLTLSFAVFTLFGSLILASLHLPDDAIRWAGLALLVLVGLGLLVPALGHLLERPFYRFPQRVSGTGGNGFVLGIALGAVFVPCAGPVLAAITVAGASDHIGLRAIGLTLGFAVGTAIPLLAFALAGRGLSQRLAAFRRHQGAIRAVSGVVMIVLAVALTFNLSDLIQRDIPNYTQAVGNSLEKGAAAPAAGASVSLQNCQQAALYGGSGVEDCGAAPAFTGIQQWFNTPGGTPVTLASLKGKVVIVDFWAYSCINCQRELPHVEAWYKDYAADGLEVVGVQTPEYAFEHVPSNVQAGARRLGLTFPVALDNSYDTWNAYDNQSWPAGYIIDATGQIRHVSIG
ncbi:MAG: cytochrome c biogenesis protein/redoxin, partial [Trebonia sp.]